MIKQRLVKKSIDMMADLARSNVTAYDSFWKNQEVTSLPDYVERMPDDRQAIYYVVGETRAQAAMSPALEKLKEKNYEILYVSEPIDEMTLQNIEKFSDKEIVDAGKETSQSLSEDEKKEKQKANDDSEGFRQWMKGVLGERITRVEVSTRLVDSPATIVQSEYGVSPNMQKYLRAQAVVEEDSKGEFTNIFNQAVLEINPEHPIIQNLMGLKDEESAADEAKEVVELVFNTAALAAGYMLDNAADYSRIVTNMMTRMAKK